MCTSVFSFGQKANLTDAILLMRKFDSKNGIEPSLKLLNEAKKFIDLAAVNTETANNPKMHLCRGEIYFGLIEIADIEAASTGKVMDETLASEYEKIAKESFKKLYLDPKTIQIVEAENYINARVTEIFNKGVIAYTASKFEEATLLFLKAYEYSKYTNKIYEDAANSANTSLNQAVNIYLTNKEYDKAKTLTQNVYKHYPSNISVLICLINIYIADNDFINTDKYTNEALAIDPNNKQLYYVLGTSYMTLKQYEKADQALTKALAIDSSYSAAQYQLGAVLLEWAYALKYQIGQMDYKDPQAPILEAQAKDMLLRAIPLLEAYSASNPSAIDILEILQKLHGRMGNKEKSEALKKRIEEMKIAEEKRLAEEKKKAEEKKQ